MTNIRGKEIDNTHLSIDQAEARGFLHRDYIAHCLRWTHVVKYMSASRRYKSLKILDVGCGREVPLAKLMYSSRLIPVPEEGGCYVGVDYNALTIPEMLRSGKFPLRLIQNCVFPDQFTPSEKIPDKYDVIICFEVAEHVEPEGTLKLLRGIHDHLTEEGVAFISTPCYNAETGAAGNHVNEMSYQAFGAMLEYTGLDIVDSHGTFASMKDYKPYMTPSQRDVFNQLQEYYDSNYLATIFAPLFPAYSRNCLWKVRRVTINEDGSSIGSCHFGSLIVYGATSHSSSDKWSEFIYEIAERNL
jgi:SAM-dependent methyltransferase